MNPQQTQGKPSRQTGLTIALAVKPTLLGKMLGGQKVDDAAPTSILTQSLATQKQRAKPVNKQSETLASMMRLLNPVALTRVSIANQASTKLNDEIEEFVRKQDMYDGVDLSNLRCKAGALEVVGYNYPLGMYICIYDRQQANGPKAPREALSVCRTNARKEEQVAGTEKAGRAQAESSNNQRQQSNPVVFFLFKEFIPFSPVPPKDWVQVFDRRIEGRIASILEELSKKASLSNSRLSEYGLNVKKHGKIFDLSVLVQYAYSRRLSFRRRLLKDYKKFQSYQDQTPKEILDIIDDGVASFIKLSQRAHTMITEVSTIASNPQDPLFYTLDVLSPFSTIRKRQLVIHNPYKNIFTEYATRDGQQNLVSLRRDIRFDQWRQFPNMIDFAPDVVAEIDLLDSVSKTTEDTRGYVNKSGINTRSNERASFSNARGGFLTQEADIDNTFDRREASNQVPCNMGSEFMSPSALESGALRRNDLCLSYATPSYPKSINCFYARDEQLYHVDMEAIGSTNFPLTNRYKNVVILQFLKYITVNMKSVVLEPAKIFQMHSQRIRPLVKDMKQWERKEKERQQSLMRKPIEQVQEQKYESYYKNLLDEKGQSKEEAATSNVDVEIPSYYERPDSLIMSCQETFKTIVLEHFTELRNQIQSTLSELNNVVNLQYSSHVVDMSKQFMKEETDKFINRLSNNLTNCTIQHPKPQKERTGTKSSLNRLIMNEKNLEFTQPNEEATMPTLSNSIVAIQRELLPDYLRFCKGFNMYASSKISSMFLSKLNDWYYIFSLIDPNMAFLLKEQPKDDYPLTSTKRSEYRHYTNSLDTRREFKIIDTTQLNKYLVGQKPTILLIDKPSTRQVFTEDISINRFIAYASDILFPVFKLCMKKKKVYLEPSVNDGLKFVKDIIESVDKLFESTDGISISTEKEGNSRISILPGKTSNFTFTDIQSDIGKHYVAAKTQFENICFKMNKIFSEIKDKLQTLVKELPGNDLLNIKFRRNTKINPGGPPPLSADLSTIPFARFKEVLNTSNDAQQIIKSLPSVGWISIFTVSFTMFKRAALKSLATRHARLSEVLRTLFIDIILKVEEHLTVTKSIVEKVPDNPDELEYIIVVAKRTLDNMYLWENLIGQLIIAEGLIADMRIRLPESKQNIFFTIKGMPKLIAESAKAVLQNANVIRDKFRKELNTIVTSISNFTAGIIPVTQNATSLTASDLFTGNANAFTKMSDYESSVFNPNKGLSQSPELNTIEDNETDNSLGVIGQPQLKKTRFTKYILSQIGINNQEIKQWDEVSEITGEKGKQVAKLRSILSSTSKAIDMLEKWASDLGENIIIPKDTDPRKLLSEVEPVSDVLSALTNLINGYRDITSNTIGEINMKDVQELLDGSYKALQDAMVRLPEDHPNRSIVEHLGKQIQGITPDLELIKLMKSKYFEKEGTKYVHQFGVTPTDLMASSTKDVLNSDIGNNIKTMSHKLTIQKKESEIVEMVRATLQYYYRLRFNTDALLDINNINNLINRSLVSRRTLNLMFMVLCKIRSWILKYHNIGVVHQLLIFAENMLEKAYISTSLFKRIMKKCSTIVECYPYISSNSAFNNQLKNIIFQYKKLLSTIVTVQSVHHVSKENNITEKMIGLNKNLDNIFYLLHTLHRKEIVFSMNIFNTLLPNMELATSDQYMSRFVPFYGNAIIIPRVRLLVDSFVSDESTELSESNDIDNRMSIESDSSLSKNANFDENGSYDNSTYITIYKGLKGFDSAQYRMPMIRFTLTERRLLAKLIEGPNPKDVKPLERQHSLRCTLNETSPQDMEKTKENFQQMERAITTRFFYCPIPYRMLKKQPDIIFNNTYDKRFYLNRIMNSVHDYSCVQGRKPQEVAENVYAYVIQSIKYINENLTEFNIENISRFPYQLLLYGLRFQGSKTINYVKLLERLEQFIYNNSYLYNIYKKSVIALAKKMYVDKKENTHENMRHRKYKTKYSQLMSSRKQEEEKIDSNSYFNLICLRSRVIELIEFEDDLRYIIYDKETMNEYIFDESFEENVNNLKLLLTYKGGVTNIEISPLYQGHAKECELLILPPPLRKKIDSIFVLVLNNIPIKLQTYVHGLNSEKYAIPMIQYMSRLVNRPVYFVTPYFNLLDHELIGLANKDTFLYHQLKNNYHKDNCPYCTGYKKTNEYDEGQFLSRVANLLLSGFILVFRDTELLHQRTIIKLNSLLLNYINTRNTGDNMVIINHSLKGYDKKVEVVLEPAIQHRNVSYLKGSVVFIEERQTRLLNNRYVRIDDNIVSQSFLYTSILPGVQVRFGFKNVIKEMCRCNDFGDFFKTEGKESNDKNEHELMSVPDLLDYNILEKYYNMISSINHRLQTMERDKEQYYYLFMLSLFLPLNITLYVRNYISSTVVSDECELEKVKTKCTQHHSNYTKKVIRRVIICLINNMFPDCFCKNENNSCKACCSNKKELITFISSMLGFDLHYDNFNSYYIGERATSTHSESQDHSQTSELQSGGVKNSAHKKSHLWKNIRRPDEALTISFQHFTNYGKFLIDGALRALDIFRVCVLDCYTLEGIKDLVNNICYIKHMNAVYISDFNPTELYKRTSKFLEFLNHQKLLETKKFMSVERNEEEQYVTSQENASEQINMTANLTKRNYENKDNGPEIEDDPLKMFEESSDEDLKLLTLEHNNYNEYDIFTTEHLPTKRTGKGINEGERLTINSSAISNSILVIDMTTCSSIDNSDYTLLINSIMTGSNPYINVKGGQYLLSLYKYVILLRNKSVNQQKDKEPETTLDKLKQKTHNRFWLFYNKFPHLNVFNCPLNTHYLIKLILNNAYFINKDKQRQLESLNLKEFIVMGVKKLMYHHFGNLYKNSLNKACGGPECLTCQCCNNSLNDETSDINMIKATYEHNNNYVIHVISILKLLMAFVFLFADQMGICKMKIIGDDVSLNAHSKRLNVEVNYHVNRAIESEQETSSNVPASNTIENKMPGLVQSTSVMFGNQNLRNKKLDINSTDLTKANNITNFTKILELSKKITPLKLNSKDKADEYIKATKDLVSAKQNGVVYEYKNQHSSHARYVNYPITEQDLSNSYNCTYLPTSSSVTSVMEQSKLVFRVLPVYFSRKLWISAFYNASIALFHFQHYVLTGKSATNLTAMDFSIFNPLYSFIYKPHIGGYMLSPPISLYYLNEIFYVDNYKSFGPMRMNMSSSKFNGTDNKQDLQTIIEEPDDVSDDMLGQNSFQVEKNNVYYGIINVEKYFDVTEINNYKSGFSQAFMPKGKQETSEQGAYCYYYLLPEKPLRKPQKRLLVKECVTPDLTYSLSPFRSIRPKANYVIRRYYQQANHIESLRKLEQRILASNSLNTLMILVFGMMLSNNQYIFIDDNSGTFETVLELIRTYVIRKLAGKEHGYVGSKKKVAELESQGESSNETMSHQEPSNSSMFTDVESEACSSVSMGVPDINSTKTKYYNEKKTNKFPIHRTKLTYIEVGRKYSLGDIFSHGGKNSWSIDGDLLVLLNNINLFKNEDLFSEFGHNWLKNLYIVKSGRNSIFHHYIQDTEKDFFGNFKISFSFLPFNLTYFETSQAIDIRDKFKFNYPTLVSNTKEKERIVELAEKYKSETEQELLSQRYKLGYYTSEDMNGDFKHTQNGALINDLNLKKLYRDNTEIICLPSYQLYKIIFSTAFLDKASIQSMLLNMVRFNYTSFKNEYLCSPFALPGIPTDTLFKHYLESLADKASTSPSESFDMDESIPDYANCIAITQKGLMYYYNPFEIRFVNELFNRYDIGYNFFQGQTVYHIQKSTARFIVEYSVLKKSDNTYRVESNKGNFEPYLIKPKRSLLYNIAHELDEQERVNEVKQTDLFLARHRQDDTNRFCKAEHTIVEPNTGVYHTEEYTYAYYNPHNFEKGIIILQPSNRFEEIYLHYYGDNEDYKDKDKYLYSPDIETQSHLVLLIKYDNISQIVSVLDERNSSILVLTTDSNIRAVNQNEFGNMKTLRQRYSETEYDSIECTPNCKIIDTLKHIVNSVVNNNADLTDEEFNNALKLQLNDENVWNIYRAYLNAVNRLKNESSVHTYSIPFVYYLDMYMKLLISHFSKVYNVKKSYLDVMNTTSLIKEKINSKEYLQEIVNKLEQTKENISNLIGFIKKRETTLNESLKQIEIMKKNMTEEKEQQKKAEMLARNQLQRYVPALERAKREIEGLSKQHIAEVRSMANPPKNVVLVMEAVNILLGEDIDIALEEDLLSYFEKTEIDMSKPLRFPQVSEVNINTKTEIERLRNSWIKVRVILSNASFLRRLTQVVSDIDDVVLNRLLVYSQKYRSYLEPNTFEKISVAGKSLATFVQATLEYSLSMKKSNPILQKIREYTVRINELQKRVAIEEEIYKKHEQEIVELNKAHDMKIEEMKSLEINLKQRRENLSSIIELLNTIDTVFNDNWHISIAKCDYELTKLHSRVQDCLDVLLFNACDNFNLLIDDVPLGTHSDTYQPEVASERKSFYMLYSNGISYPYNILYDIVHESFTKLNLVSTFSFYVSVKMNFLLRSNLVPVVDILINNASDADPENFAFVSMNVSNMELTFFNALKTSSTIVVNDIHLYSPQENVRFIMKILKYKLGKGSNNIDYLRHEGKQIKFPRPLSEVNLIFVLKQSQIFRNIQNKWGKEYHIDPCLLRLLVHISDNYEQFIYQFSNELFTKISPDMIASELRTTKQLKPSLEQGTMCYQLGDIMKNVRKLDKLEKEKNVHIGKIKECLTESVIDIEECNIQLKLFNKSDSKLFNVGDKMYSIYKSFVKRSRLEIFVHHIDRILDYYATKYSLPELKLYNEESLIKNVVSEHCEKQLDLGFFYKGKDNELIMLHIDIVRKYINGLKTVIDYKHMTIITIRLLLELDLFFNVINIDTIIQRLDPESPLQQHDIIRMRELSEADFNMYNSILELFIGLVTKGFNYGEEHPLLKNENMRSYLTDLFMTDFDKVYESNTHFVVTAIQNMEDGTIMNHLLATQAKICTNEHVIRFPVEIYSATPIKLLAFCVYVSKYVPLSMVKSRFSFIPFCVISQFLSLYNIRILSPNYLSNKSKLMLAEQNKTVIDETDQVSNQLRDKIIEIFTRLSIYNIRLMDALKITHYYKLSSNDFKTDKNNNPFVKSLEEVYSTVYMILYERHAYNSNLSCNIPTSLLEFVSSVCNLYLEGNDEQCYTIPIMFDVYDTTLESAFSNLVESDSYQSLDTAPKLKAVPHKDQNNYQEQENGGHYRNETTSAKSPKGKYFDGELSNLSSKNVSRYFSNIIFVIKSTYFQNPESLLQRITQILSMRMAISKKVPAGCFFAVEVVRTNEEADAQLYQQIHSVLLSLAHYKIRYCKINTFTSFAECMEYALVRATTLAYRYFDPSKESFDYKHINNFKDVFPITPFVTTYKGMQEFRYFLDTFVEQNVFNGLILMHAYLLSNRHNMGPELVHIDSLMEYLINTYLNSRIYKCDFDKKPVMNLADNSSITFIEDMTLSTSNMSSYSSSGERLKDSDEENNPNFTENVSSQSESNFITGKKNQRLPTILQAALENLTLLASQSCNREDYLSAFSMMFDFCSSNQLNTLLDQVINSSVVQTQSGFFSEKYYFSIEGPLRKLVMQARLLEVNMERTYISVFENIYTVNTEAKKNLTRLDPILFQPYCMALFAREKYDTTFDLVESKIVNLVQDMPVQHIPANNDSGLYDVSFSLAHKYVFAEKLCFVITTKLSNLLLVDASQDIGEAADEKESTYLCVHTLCHFRAHGVYLSEAESPILSPKAHKHDKTQTMFLTDVPNSNTFVAHLVACNKRQLLKSKGVLHLDCCNSKDVLFCLELGERAKSISHAMKLRGANVELMGVSDDWVTEHIQ